MNVDQIIAKAAEANKPARPPRPPLPPLDWVEAIIFETEHLRLALSVAETPKYSVYSYKIMGKTSPFVRPQLENGGFGTPRQTHGAVAFAGEVAQLFIDAENWVNEREAKFFAEWQERQASQEARKSFGQGGGQPAATKHTGKTEREKKKMKNRK